jgi:hypothetical protein
MQALPLGETRLACDSHSAAVPVSVAGVPAIRHLPPSNIGLPRESPMSRLDEDIRDIKATLARLEAMIIRIDVHATLVRLDAAVMQRMPHGQATVAAPPAGARERHRPAGCRRDRRCALSAALRGRSSRLVGERNLFDVRFCG